MPLGMEVGLGPGDCVLWGTSSPQKKGTPTLGPCLLWPNGAWIKMPLGMKVNLGPGDVVLDGVAAPLKF